jgi:hypothetical protein
MDIINESLGNLISDCQNAIGRLLGTKKQYNPIIPIDRIFSYLY